MLGPKAWAVSGVCLAALLLVTEVAYWIGARVSPEAEASVRGDCVVLVLGYPSESDGRAHPIQRMRARAGVEIFRTNACERIVFSGGAVGNRHVEAETMASIARELGVRRQDIVTEARARNTWENVGCSLPHFERTGRILIVSDSLHVHRAKRYACQQRPALCPKIVAAGTNPSLSHLWWKIPGAAHELIAAIRDSLLGRAAGVPACSTG